MKSRNKQDVPPQVKGLLLLAGFIIGAITIRFFFLIMEIKTDSMEPALKRGDLVLISRLSSISKGNIAVFKSPAEEGLYLVSRAVASEYENIEIRNRIIYINNERFDHPVLTSEEKSSIFPMKFSHRDNMPPVRLGRGEFFMICDNSDKGFDSRTLGPVKNDSIAGRIVYIYEKQRD